MKQIKLAVSREAPSQRDTMWAKPVDGGFGLYILEGGTWKPVKLVDDNGTPQTADDEIVIPIEAVKVNNVKVTPDKKKAVNIKIEEGTTDGSLKVNNTDVPVKGLSSAAFMQSGTFEDKPASPTAGQPYFCTDKQTTEGSANGIVIYWNGTNWTDALGRTVS